MREQITFEAVKTQEQFDELKALAQTDGHRLDDGSLTPIVAMRRGGKLIGWFHVLNMPVVMPCFSVENCGPRDFADACTAIKSIYQFASMSDRFPNGTMFMAIPPSPVIDEQVIKEHLGFEDMHRCLWQATPKTQ